MGDEPEVKTMAEVTRIKAEEEDLDQRESEGTHGMAEDGAGRTAPAEAMAQQHVGEGSDPKS